MPLRTYAPFSERNYLEVHTNMVLEAKLQGKTIEKPGSDKIKRADWVTDQKFEMEKL